jgi:hypothetical protein
LYLKAQTLIQQFQTNTHKSAHQSSFTVSPSLTFFPIGNQIASWFKEPIHHVRQHRITQQFLTTLNSIAFIQFYSTKLNKFSQKLQCSTSPSKSKRANIKPKAQHSQQQLNRKSSQCSSKKRCCDSSQHIPSSASEYAWQAHASPTVSRRQYKKPSATQYESIVTILLCNA